jgi:hypothetical protein
MPFFSTIIPSFNRAALIAQTLDSVLAQEFADNEIIVVDDGSTDGTLDILAGYADRIRLVQQPNGGPGAARNRGVEHATGKYVAFLDSDDLWFPWTLATYKAVIDQNGGPSIVTGPHADFYDGTELDALRPCPPRHRSYADFLASPRSWIIPSGLVLTPQAHRAAGGFRTDIWICEDGDYWLRLGCAPGFVQIAAPTTVGYRLHQGGISQAYAGRAKGVNALLDAEQAGAYPGGGGRQRERMDYICTHARATSLACLRTGQKAAGIGIYRRTLAWNLRLGRWRYVAGFPAIATLQAARSFASRLLGRGRG